LHEKPCLPAKGGTAFCSKTEFERAEDAWRVETEIKKPRRDGIIWKKKRRKRFGERFSDRLLFYLLCKLHILRMNIRINKRNLVEMFVFWVKRMKEKC